MALRKTSIALSKQVRQLIRDCAYLSNRTDSEYFRATLSHAHDPPYSERIALKLDNRTSDLDPQIFTVRLDPELHDDVKKTAKSIGLSTSEYVDRIVLKFLVHDYRELQRLGGRQAPYDSTANLAAGEQAKKRPKHIPGRVTVSYSG